MSDSLMTITRVLSRTLVAASMLVSLLAIDVAAQAPVAPAPPPGPVARMPDGKPDLNGFFQSDHGGANWGLEPHKEAFTGGGRGVIIDPPDGKLPYQPWAREEKASRARPERGYDDPTAHCIVAGVPRSLWVPAPVHIFQTPDHVVFLHERMSWRTVYLNRKTHLPDTIRLWQGDSIGRWEGDTLVVETKNLNGKPWLNEVGDVISHTATIVERFTPVNANRIDYQVTVTDPSVYTRPWTAQIPINRQPGEMLEVACLEDNQDLKHLKEVRDEARAKAAAEGAK
jgi:hypothetical protein